MSDLSPPAGLPRSPGVKGLAALALALLLGLLIGERLALAQPAETSGGQQVELWAGRVAQARWALEKATALADRLDLEILKRQQQLLTARRNGGDVGQAESELELSRDKHRLALAQQGVEENRLALSQHRLEQAQLELESGSGQGKTGLAEAEQQAWQARLAAIGSRLSSLRGELAASADKLQQAETEAARLASALEVKWGDRLSGKKPKRQRVYQAAPNPDAPPEPEEATEL